jgi:large-conductance mechanosensitive channel
MADTQRKSKTEQTRVVASGTTVRIEEPQSPHHHQKMHIVIEAEDLPGSGFIKFLREHAIVGLAIGFVIGTQLQVLVQQLVKSFINPAFLLLFGQDLTHRSFVLSFHGRHESFGWGAFAYGLLNFIFILGAVYLLVKYLSLEKLDKPKKKDPQLPPPQ